MNNNKITIIHFLPLELYPPVMNLLNYLSNSELDITVFTTKPYSKLKHYENKAIKIKRYEPIIPTQNIFQKLLKYFIFYLSTFWQLFKFNPRCVLYYETYSAPPAIWYKKIKNSVHIFVHYHEIVTLEEFNLGRPLVKYVNSIEQKYFRKYNWISQTNAKRLSIFAEQYGLSKKANNLHTLPNYPPQSWVNSPKKKRKNNQIVKLLYIGSQYVESMYLEEVLNQFGSNPNFSIDFYSHRFPSEVKNAINKHKNCHMREAVNYKDIPKLKGIYDVGLVLYKGLSTNFKYNAPNKLFEYLALDLDVWCSDKLITAKNHERTDCYPKVIMVDYENLNNFNIKNALDKSNLNYKPSPYTSDKVYHKILKELYKKLDS